jgi:orotate phosphoribosyltransferase
MDDARRQDLIQLLVEHQVLRFGSFTLKSGRQSPYFFNLGALHTGAAIQRLAECYAACIESHELDFDVLFGPAYKGIPIAVATAEALARSGRDVPGRSTARRPRRMVRVASSSVPRSGAGSCWSTTC